jgi:hypothetical protein
MGRDTLKDDDTVLIEAMDFMWKLPWKDVKDDVERGFAIFVEKFLTNAENLI